MRKIGLAMIVRDGEAHVERCIRSALPLISRWTVIDTGSVDDTREIVKATLAHLPGQLLESPWVGHAHNRTELLAIARHGCDYNLSLDADMEIVIEGDLPELTADAYAITIRDRGLEYPLPLLTNTAKPFFYAGVAHAYLACAEEYESVWLRELAILDHGGGASQGTGKMERDRDALAAQIGKDPSDRRSWFYLAQSYRDLDQIDEAIAAYRMRASMGGWDEEVYYARYQLGVLLCEHRNAREGMQHLLDAWLAKPDRVEALRALSNVASNVADKIPRPVDDVLFVRPSEYTASAPSVLPPLPSLAPGPRRVARVRNGVLDRRDVAAVIVTRGNVDLAPILDLLPFEETVIWDNSKREHDYKPFGRYAAIPETTKPVIFWIDDDVILSPAGIEALLAAYQPGKIVCNMDQAWIDGAGYGDELAMMGAGSLCDAWLPEQVFASYLERYPFDDDLLVEADFAFGTLASFQRIDVGYEVREFADDPDRLYQQEGQTRRKWRMLERCRALRDELREAAA